SHLTCGGPFEGANRYNIIDEADLASAWRCASTANIGTPQATPAAVSSSAASLGGLDLTGKAAVLKTGLAMRGRLFFRKLPHEEGPFAVIRNHPPAQSAAQQTEGRRSLDIARINDDDE